MKPLGKVKIRWSGKFAYAIGLLTSDGNLSKDGRHIDFTSKDLDLAETFKKCLGIDNEIGRKTRGGTKVKKYYKVVFGDVIFYRFLLSIGLCPAKSKVLKELKIPERYFGDFLRGCIDGDGGIDVFKHPEAHKLQVKLRLCSASLDFLNWIKARTNYHFRIDGGWIQKGNRVFVLTYAKRDGILIMGKIYSMNKPSLKRKYDIVKTLFTE